ncbi:hypothetical protein OH492_25585 [Vibrio chagasii]|nr:hypothetical protein [Vibrio chagasii]
MIRQLEPNPNHAMVSLINSMKWDEAFQLRVRPRYLRDRRGDFAQRNRFAMENKGLNVI